MTAHHPPNPFGAEVLHDQGAVRFRLWTPDAEQAELLLWPPGQGRETQPAVRPLPEVGDGWRNLITKEAGAGSRYLFRIDGAHEVPDPASRFQPEGVHGRSEVIDPTAYAWTERWAGRPWEEAVLYELHPGAFSPQGTFAGVQQRLDHLAALGVTALELMPVAAFPGRRNWGYDGVLPFAPDASYGRPEALKALVEAAHARGLMVLLDVVYNHFGPEGNYLHRYAARFFTDRHRTPWGAGLNFDGPDSRWVREFFIQNALYWLQEYRLDGLRLDAVHAIRDDSEPHILRELADRVQAAMDPQRRVHLILENDDNAPEYLEREPAGAPRAYTAQWNDDCHHTLHRLLTDETDGYYQDYAQAPELRLGRCLIQGYAYQGEPSPFRGNRPRGGLSGHLPPTAFVNFLQNHDQIGNRAFGERIAELTSPEALHAALALLLLAPPPPLLFMGQEWNSRRPFPFFCDFGPDLAQKVAAGRREEFAAFPAFSDPQMRACIPDPMAEATFRSAVLDWSEAERPENRRWLELHRHLLKLRRDEIVPRLFGMGGGQGPAEISNGGVLGARWRLGDGSRLFLLANLAEGPAAAQAPPPGRLLYATPGAGPEAERSDKLPPWCVLWHLQSGSQL